MVSFPARLSISFFTNPENPIPRTLQNCTIFNLTSRNPNPQKSSLSCSVINRPFTIQASTVAQKVHSLNFEFKSLPDPIDRVKRLLHYATILPPSDGSLRIKENRVSGCTAQVWLEVKMDENGIVSFRVDSDSEITKGFCSCLIRVLDGSDADDVVSVRTEDLLELNVGLASKVSSRFNAWHNVLISMQRRTKDLVMEKNCDQIQCCLEEDGSCLVGDVSMEAARKLRFCSEFHIQTV